MFTMMMMTMHIFENNPCQIWCAKNSVHLQIITTTFVLITVYCTSSSRRAVAHRTYPFDMN